MRQDWSGAATELPKAKGRHEVTESKAFGSLRPVCESLGRMHVQLESVASVVGHSPVENAQVSLPTCEGSQSHAPLSPTEPETRLPTARTTGFR